MVSSKPKLSILGLDGLRDNLLLNIHNTICWVSSMHIKLVFISVPLTSLLGSWFVDKHVLFLLTTAKRSPVRTCPRPDIRLPLYVYAWLHLLLSLWGMHFCCYIVYMLSPVRLSATPWTIAHQAPLSMEFSR